MVVRLRAHHLLCVLTYVGKGYTPEFIEGYDRIVARLAAGETVEMVEGPDDVCAPLLGSEDRHCDARSTGMRDARAAEMVEALIGLPAHPGARLRLDRETLAALRETAAAGRFVPVCAGCPWLPLCRQVAGDGYPGVRLEAGC